MMMMMKVQTSLVAAALLLLYVTPAALAQTTTEKTQHTHEELGYVVCGDPNHSGCIAKDGLIEYMSPKSSKHEVRCCSDHEITGWVKRNDCPYGVWSESNLFETDEQLPGSEICHHASTYEEAKAICSVNGNFGINGMVGGSARLCTREEVLDRCARSTGCSHDSDLIWTLTEPKDTSDLIEKQWMSCGKRQSCGATGGHLVDKDDINSKAHVRCCSDTPITGWKQNNGCSIWTESDKWGSCSGNVTYAEAELICYNANARLCTITEVLNNCARNTGCEYDTEYIWTGSVGYVEDFAPTSEPSGMPSSSPSLGPTSVPSNVPSEIPSSSPSYDPSSGPSDMPSDVPSTSPTLQPTPGPTSSDQTCHVGVGGAICSCPFVDLEQPVMISAPDHHVRLAIPTGSDQLCTLVQMDISKPESTKKPVGRSYGGNDWEQYSGEFASSVRFNCDDDDGNGGGCTVNLPDPPIGHEYYLIAFQHSLPRQEDEIARFLEQTTFGPTKNEIGNIINAMDTNNNQEGLTSKADYLLSQIQTKGMTSHRAYWRSKLSAFHSLTSTAAALYGTPCTIGARYRRYAIMRDDFERYVTIKTTTTVWGDQTTVSVGSNSSGVDSLLRTVVPNVTIAEGCSSCDTGFKIPDGTYQICSRPSPMLGGRIKIRTVVFDDDGELQYDSGGDLKLSCSDNTFFGGIEGNPAVYFDTDPADIVSFSLASTETIITQEEIGQDVIIQLTQDLTSCDLANYASFGLEERVVVGVSIEHNDHWIYSATFDLKNNDLNSPLPDGGKAAVVATEGASNQDVAGTACANADRTFLNEDKCIVSNDACTLSGTNPGPYIVCGSPNEVPNDHSTDVGVVFSGGFDMQTRHNMTATDTELIDQLQTTWMEIAINAPDQLRQRVAWALSQLVVVSPDSINNNGMGEGFVHYYDIFVRHAFGNYFNILKEVTYSSVMGEMLTYLGGKSMQYWWVENNEIQYADENYAREIMQLFSIGLYKLNQDGTRQVDESGNFIRAYTNDHIMEFARIYTGFRRRSVRGNIETRSIKGSENNYIDPMKKHIEYADHLPKLGLENQYIGDGYPVCSDLPSQHFLMKGATYRFLGGDSTPELLTEIWSWGGPKRFVVAKDSGLGEALCNDPSSTGNCDFQAKVVLDSDLTSTCSGVQCEIDDPRVVEIEGVFYEYVRPACVEKAFYQNPKLIKSRDHSTGSKNYGEYMCGDPTLQAATPICCSSGSRDETRLGVLNFSKEKVTFNEAAQRCAAGPSDSKQLCEDPIIDRDECEDTNTLEGGCDRYFTMYWTSRDCTLKVKIDQEGSVAIVHDVEKEHKEAVKYDTPLFFRVDWASDEHSVGEFLSDYTNKCEEMGCTTNTTDGYCLCDANVHEDLAFNDNEFSQGNVTVKDILARATLGGVLPSDSSNSAVVGDIKYYPSGPLTTSTVFEVTDAFGVTQYRKNIKSIVRAGFGLTFRNPVHFISIAIPEPRDAEHEMDAALKQYFYNSNLAPFLAIRMIQRFGISNPTPRYVEEVASAFRSGDYTFEGGSFGSGDYGDMEAMVAAVLLDREAGSSVLDADPVHGSLLEPFMKIVRVMRSLEYENIPNKLIEIRRDLQDFVGQEAHKLPSVFSFFRPEYSPAGLVGSAGLTAPEAMVLGGPKSINLANTMISEIKYGLNDCRQGFGSGSGSCAIGDIEGSGSKGANMYSSSANSADIVDELATLLTSGRLSDDVRNMIIETYDQVALSKDDYHALVSAQQLIVLSPEFQANGLVRRTGNVREPEPLPAPKNEGYKAVINLMLAGGCDSMNMIIPSDECIYHEASGKTTKEMYNEMRGILAIDWSTEADLEIDVSGSELPQPCQKFVVNPDLPFLHDLYLKGDLAFIANTGVVNSNGMDKKNYRQKSVTQLFAHNAMQDEGQALDPHQYKPGTGGLGRAKDILTKLGYAVNSISIDNAAIATEGVAGASKPASVIGKRGVPVFADRPDDEDPSNPAEVWFDIEGLAAEINGETKADVTGIYGDTWSNTFTSGVEESNLLKGAMDNVDLGASPWYTSADKDTELHSNKIEQDHWEKWSTIYKLMQTRDTRQVDRDLFFHRVNGFDTHANMKDELSERFKGLNHGLKLMVQQLKDANLWDNVVIYINSDFGRTMVPNGKDGSDHAWGGNNIILGGGVKGGVFHGQYVHDLTYDGPLTVNPRGRYIPTTPYEAVLNGVLEWFGVTDPQDLEYCLPNKDNTVDNPFKIFTKDDLFKPPVRRQLRGSQEA